MNAGHVGSELVALCRAGKSAEAVERFYAPDIVSVEANDMPEMPAEQRGIDAIRAKHQWWHDSFDVHSETYDGPYVNGDQFTVFATIDTTMKATGQRMAMSEIALYTVRDGKIVHEAFFASPGGCG